MKKLDRVIMIEKDLEQDNKIELAQITLYKHARMAISLKQARTHEHNHVTLIRHVDTNVHQGKIHQECTPGHVYVVIVSIIQHDTYDSQRRSNASSHYTSWLTVYL
ncbi:hypothetical protein Taro_027847 [Colocasia esculenta]|uniref:Uncharacterized protein n=1 Tax=Colocasia esculenta TaxID=4460 RepID=A0A843VQ12_COLES|nr:hypothetical protein [Colocasia esculenta]